MHLNVAFGTTGLALDLPPGFDYCILNTRSAPPATDPASAVAKALDRPIGTSPLAELARGRRSAAIAVCDITRPAPNQLLLPQIVQRLETGGIPRETITILIATGLHRAATPGEVLEIVGREVAGRYRVVSHNARVLDDHTFLGNTASGTPAYVDRRFVEADLRLTVGLIEPHLMAGFSGGRKLVAPGLAAQATIERLHSPKFMRDRRAVEASYNGNPLHEELAEIARMARQDFIADAVLTSDRRLAAVFAGRPETAHRCGVEYVSQHLLQEIPQPADAVITTSAGYPLDLTFYQAIKGVTAAAHLVKNGGKILLLAACEEGAGAAEFSRMLKTFRSERGLLDHLSANPVVIDQWQLEKLALVTCRAEVLFYVPGLPAEYHKGLWGRAFASPADALAALTGSLPTGARVAVLPDGPYVLARVAPAQSTAAQTAHD